jgi:hypothetical protein
MKLSTNVEKYGPNVVESLKRRPVGMGARIGFAMVSVISDGDFRRVLKSCAVIVAVMFLSANMVVAAENVWSIEYFNSRKAEWNQLVGATIRLEGRISLLGGGKIRLAKCDMVFQVKETLSRPLGGKRSVELSGQLKREDGKLIFDVEQLRAAPTDVEQFESRTAKLRNPRPDEWYELGDWALHRSRYYDDIDLAEKAEYAYAHGVAAERRAMSADDAEARFVLARKIKNYKLPETQRIELIHEGDWLLWQAALKSETTSRDDWKRLAARLAEDLPGCTQPLTSFPAELTQSYERQPLATYRDAADDGRRKMNRLLYASVILKPIVDAASSDGRNGDAIADQIERDVPEAVTLIEKYRDLKLAWRLSRVTTTTRPEVEQLAEDFRSRKRPDQAKQALTDWLAARESRLREDGPVGLLQLADDYLALLHDEVRAVSLLNEAYKLDPAFSDVADRMKSLGYAWNGTKWIKADLAKPNPDPAPTVDTIAGGIVVGMTAAELRSRLGSPAAASRALTKAGATEVWCYGPPGTSRLVVRLERNDGSPDVRVVAFGNER